MEENRDLPIQERENDPLFINEEEEEELYSSISLLDVINDGFESVDKQLKLLMREFNSKLKYDVKKDEQIDKLYKELRGYRENLLIKSITPMIEDMIFEIEANKKRVQQLKRKEISELSPEKLLKTIEDYSEEISNILYRQGIESYESLGKIFDGNIHTINKLVEINDKLMHNTIAKSIRQGYRWENKILKKELVDIYKYNSSVEENGVETN
ncbi:nucleotide exchange factor GrpE [Clostridium cellulovorans]|uniref:GrpE protein n=1 Tax=Clostridium cellulovorans (strain ATCC 35296 / DSM 3052 / OCM 3 / 743B) TaxID=573061 RepID=D9SUX6_CLOC7|nr:nucleotide exchange factor GrpE [Clostridium cellulovorans]ADL51031.1 GrpE protein [Clostridium cellulovorans 743B]